MAYQQAAEALATTMAATATRAVLVTAATPSGWRTPTGLILMVKTNVHGRRLTGWTLAVSVLPGLSWTTAYVRGDNIKTAETSNGKEHEWFNQIQYQVQDGPAKDLS